MQQDRLSVRSIWLPTGRQGCRHPPDVGTRDLETTCWGQRRRAPSGGRHGLMDATSRRLSPLGESPMETLRGVCGDRYVAIDKGAFYFPTQQRNGNGFREKWNIRFSILILGFSSVFSSFEADFLRRVGGFCTLNF